MKYKLKALGLAGLLAITSCVSAPIPKSFQEQYGSLLLLKRHEDKVEAYYDQNNDNMADLLLIYKVNNVRDDGMLYLELISIRKDKNRDGLFTKDEAIPYKAKQEKVNPKDLI